jgi:hypothetical protein
MGRRPKAAAPFCLKKENIFHCGGFAAAMKNDPLITSA